MQYICVPTAHELQEKLSMHIPYNRWLNNIDILVDEFFGQVIENIITHSTDSNDFFKGVHIARHSYYHVILSVIKHALIVYAEIPSLLINAHYFRVLPQIFIAFEYHLE